MTQYKWLSFIRSAAGDRPAHFFMRDLRSPDG
jgi:hypothetical protein